MLTYSQDFIILVISMDSSVYFHSLRCSDDFTAAWMANGGVGGVWDYLENVKFKNNKTI